MKKSQMNFVRAKLKASGEISRNDCLSQYISRLSAIVLRLKKEEGWVLDGFSRGGDYIYKVRDWKPAPQIQIVEVNGMRVAKYV